MHYSIILATLGRNTLQKVIQSYIECDKNSDNTYTFIAVLDTYNSTDTQKEHYKQLQNTYTNADIKLLELTNTDNRDRSAARNKALDTCKSGYIVMIGDDTYIDKAFFTVLDKYKTNIGYLGYTKWIDEYADDAFYTWLLSYGQYDYGALIKGKTPSYHHFYTSSVVVHSDILADNRFINSFEGWGFEDIELGYRLYKSGLKLVFISDLCVYHDHSQTPQMLYNRTFESRKNAYHMQLLHPKLRILPYGIKKYALYIAVFIAYILNYTGYKELEWWYKWKLSWLGWRVDE